MEIASYFLQGWRWTLLLRPVGRISTLQTTRAVYVGLLTNAVLPMRIGELSRAYMISRWMEIEIVRVLPSIILERLIDGIWLVLFIGLALMLVQLPPHIQTSADIMGGFILFMTVLFIFIALYKPKGQLKMYRPKWKPVCWFMDFINKLSVGLREIGFSKILAITFFASLGFIIFQGLGFWLMIMGYGVSLSFLKVGVVILIIILGTSIPNAPSNIGSFQFFTVLGLTLFGVDKTTATGYSMVSFVLLSMMFFIFGLWGLLTGGISFATIKREALNIRRIRNPC